ncbi:hypothetical protein ACJQWK_09896 [Exserohilum turcicum]|uniref:Uncharacterized protein n=1 Tax=Exserohilum turcicum (strain 28A) TaxID=671987 RepID=R0I552_EXST2|nr:uncharacterized protein SETTUDRAFT_143625 [Exserohilum turcica Et28A]EOA80696.1 hypothetical protein SETTUDRAFT_143625 [Exserohilum turcica Et28A]
MLLHHCSCTYDTPVSFSPFAFSQNISCSHCGVVSTGINVQAKAQEDANMQQDELARLFSANMSLSPTHVPSVQPVQQPEPEPAPNHIVYASQHYTHSYHVPLRSASEPSLKTQMDASEMEAVLLRNSIDPSLLFPSQIDLFRNADDDQRLRLLELWRISPPAGRQGHPAGVDYNMSRQLYDWPPTSLAQEEAMAKLRFERHQADAAQKQQELEQVMAAEPYMASGYEMMARREYEESARAEKALQESSRYNPATDPVYKTGNGLWEKNVGSVADMENNYGAFAYAREYGFQAGFGDEEMVM